MTVPVIFIGVFAIISGMAIVCNRKAIASSIAEGQKSMFGRLGKFLAGQSKPVGVAMAGVGFVVIGVAEVVMGILIPPDRF